MNLVKWFRKNNTKLMAVVVIVLMIGFIGGSSLTYLLKSRGDVNKVMAYYGDNTAIKGTEIYEAQQDMDILETLQAGTILKALQVPYDQTPDLHSLALGELLFSEQRPAPEIISYIQQAIDKYQYKINNKQISDLYERTVPNYYYWLFLKKEAENAGFGVQKEVARTLLAQAIPDLLKVDYTAYMGNIMRSKGMSEDRILSVFGKLLAVLRYAHAVSSGQDITIKQLQHLTTSQMESVNVEFVKFDTGKFTKNQETPTEQQIAQQFEQYKQFVPNQITDGNPCGFGYKLPDRVQLEYLAVRFDDIKKIVDKPTSDELEEFYNKNKSSSAITEEVLSDPNNPSSQKIIKVKKFHEVSDMISDYLLQEKNNKKALSIIQEAKKLADGTLQDINDAKLKELSIEQRKEKAGNYTNIAEQLKANYKIPIYQGMTGELSAAEMQTDQQLSSLYMEGYVNELRLTRLAFTVEPLKMGTLGVYETLKPEIYLSMAPVRDKSGTVLAIARVIKAVKASVPESINEQYSIKSVVFDPNQKDTKKDTFSVKEKVTDDLKRLAAMDTAKSKADEFLSLALPDGQNWENIVEKFNELYGPAKQDDPNDPNVSGTELAKDANDIPFELKKLYSLRRLTKANRYTFDIQNEGDPVAEEVKNLYVKESMFLDKLFSMLPKDSNAPEFKPTIVEFKPDMSYYVVKNISVNRLWKEDYERIKAISSFREDHFATQGMALVQFNPENILKRMNIRFPDEKEKSKDEEPNAADK